MHIFVFVLCVYICIKYCIEREKAKRRKKNSLRISEREKEVDEGAKCGGRERQRGN